MLVSLLKYFDFTTVYTHIVSRFMYGITQEEIIHTVHLQGKAILLRLLRLLTVY